MKIGFKGEKSSKKYIFSTKKVKISFFEKNVGQSIKNLQTLQITLLNKNLQLYKLVSYNQITSYNLQESLSYLHVLSYCCCFNTK